MIPRTVVALILFLYISLSNVSRFVLSFVRLGSHCIRSLALCTFVRCQLFACGGGVFVCVCLSLLLSFIVTL